VKLQQLEAVDRDALVLSDGALARDHIGDRVRHFARLRAAHRALSPSSADPFGEADPALIGSIRDCLRSLKEQVDRANDEVAVSRAVLQQLDDTLDAIRRD
jgi:hypothetical protein